MFHDVKQNKGFKNLFKRKNTKGNQRGESERKKSEEVVIY